MALWADLTQADKDIVTAWDRNFRGWINGLARQLVEARALQASKDATGGAADIIATLDAGEDIPNTGGLAGAQDLDKADINALITGLDGFITTYDTAATRQRMAQAAGPTAGLS
jgi:hypothetical protein